MIQNKQKVIDLSHDFPPTKICINPKCEKAGEHQPRENFSDAFSYKDNKRSKCRPCCVAADKRSKKRMELRAIANGQNS